MIALKVQDAPPSLTHHHVAESLAVYVRGLLQLLVRLLGLRYARADVGTLDRIPLLVPGWIGDRTLTPARALARGNVRGYVPLKSIGQILI